MKKLDYCPECSIGLNSRESEMGFCQNCKHNWDDNDIDDSNECCDDCGCYHGHHPWCDESDEQDDW